MKTHAPGPLRKVFLGLAATVFLTAVSYEEAFAFASWAPDTYYPAGTIVSYDGDNYQALVNQTDYSGTGWNPTVASLWMRVSESSPPSAPPVPANPPSQPSQPPGLDNCQPSWSSSKVYVAGDVASFQGVNHRANWWNQGQNPSGHSGPAGGGQPWTFLGTCSSSTSQPSPQPPPQPPQLPQPPDNQTGSGDAFIFSPYKDATISMNWNTNVISSKVTGQLIPVLSSLPSGVRALTLAFATGECGNENWGGVPGANLAQANVQAFAAANVDYVISTGGAAGAFKCGSDAGMAKFIDRYATKNLIGIDFDIEAGQSQDDIDNLVKRAIFAEKKYPNLRFSFTLATLAESSGHSEAWSWGAVLPIV